MRAAERKKNICVSLYLYIYACARGSNDVMVVMTLSLLFSAAARRTE